MARGLPLVSYILVNWRTSHLLSAALTSIERQSYGLREVILVDNGSADFDPAIEERFRLAKVIRNERNLGFATANNQGIAACQGDVVVLVNCDAVLDREFTSRAIEVFDANPRIGTVVPKVLLGDGSGRLDSAGHIMYTDRTPANRGHGELDQGQYDHGGFCFGGSAAAIAYRREMLSAIAERDIRGRDGGMREEIFDESFFAYYEDVDLDWRAQLAGWRAYYEPRCGAWHQAHGSGGIRDRRIALRNKKNRYLMLAKNDTLAGIVGALGPCLTYEAYFALKTLAQPSQWLWWLLLLAALPLAWSKRFRAGHSRVIPPARVAQQFIARGLLPPPPPAPPMLRSAPLLERPEERRASAPESNLWPLVSALVVNYNGMELTRGCLAALSAQSYEPLEIVLLDNGSASDEASFLGVTFPAIKTLRLERNHGFAGGVNWGLTLCQGEYVVLVNNDCLPDVDCIRRLVYAAKRSGAKAVSGRLIDVRTPAELSAARSALALDDELESNVAWDMPPGAARAIEESFQNHALSLAGFIVPEGYGARQECFYPSGGLCLLERESIAPLLPELFPHRYFAYHEDVWLGFMLRSRGLGVAKEPRAAAVHLASSTARRLGRPRLRFYQERNRWLNLLAFLPRSAIARLWGLWTLQNIALATALLARPGDLAGMLAAHSWLSWHLPTLIRWRRHCRDNATAPDEAWLGELSGAMRGRGGWLNRFSLAICRLQGIPHREARYGAASTDPAQEEHDASA